VEFALVLPLLVMLVFGIIDYGLLYNNSLSLRQGIRESARQGVVRNFTTTGCTTGTDLVNLVCKIVKDLAMVGNPSNFSINFSPSQNVTLAPNGLHLCYHAPSTPLCN